MTAEGVVLVADAEIAVEDSASVAAAVAANLS